MVGIRMSTIQDISGNERAIPAVRRSILAVDHKDNAMPLDIGLDERALAGIEMSPRLRTVLAMTFRPAGCHVADGANYVVPEADLDGEVSTSWMETPSTMCSLSVTSREVTFRRYPVNDRADEQVEVLSIASLLTTSGSLQAFEMAADL